MIGRAAVKARMRPAAIVEVEIAPDRCACLGDGVIGSEIDLLIFDAAVYCFVAGSMPAPTSLPVVAGPASIAAVRPGRDSLGQ